MLMIFDFFMFLSMDTNSSAVLLAIPTHEVKSKRSENKLTYVCQFSNVFNV